VILAVGIYLLGIVIGLARGDGRAGSRISLALAWPIGPLAFLVTVAALVLASLIAFPWIGGAVAAVAVGWLLLR
jgi:hypothetical protein